MEEHIRDITAGDAEDLNQTEQALISTSRERRENNGCEERGNGFIKVEEAHIGSLRGCLQINFGKVYTIEHNIKSRSAGMVTSVSMSSFETFARDAFGI